MAGLYNSILNFIRMKLHSSYVAKKAFPFQKADILYAVFILYMYVSALPLTTYYYKTNITNEHHTMSGAYCLKGNSTLVKTK